VIYTLDEKTKEVLNEEALRTIARLTYIRPENLRLTTNSAGDNFHASIMVREGESNGFCLCNFALAPMPGNDLILVSHEVSVSRFQRGRGIGTLMASYREEIARKAGAEVLVATVREDNIVERTLLLKQGWKTTGSFASNYMEKHVVEFWSKQL